MLNPLNQLIGKSFHYTLVYYRNPKCASSSIFSALGPRNLFWREKKFLDLALSKDKKYGGVFDTTHVLPAETRKLFGRGLDNFFSFTCVRNPFDKQISQHAFSRAKNWGRLYGLPDDGSFSEWCEVLWKKRKDQTFWPVIPQTKFSHEVPLNFILKFETLNKDWQQMLSGNNIEGLPTSLPHENQSKHQPWQEVITEKDADIIREIFACDFEKLNYSLKI